MAEITPQELPQDSLLAQHRGPECHRDAYAVTIPRAVSLAEFIAAFYGGMPFTPERKLLGLIGRGASRADIAALAEGRTTHFAAWDVEARIDARSSSEAIAQQRSEILLRDFQDHTCSWLAVESSSDGTVLWFGSGVRNPDRGLVRLLMPFHYWYSRVLLGGAVRRLG